MSAGFLPPYSPDCNLIEVAFSKRQTFPRGAGARTRVDRDQAITSALGTIASDPLARRELTPRPAPDPRPSRKRES